MRAALALAIVLSISGCYLELGIGFTGAVGPRVDTESADAYIVVGSGFQFDDGGPVRVAVGTSFQSAGIDFDDGYAAPMGYGVCVGYDHRIRQLGPSTQLRLSGRATLWDLISTMDAPGPQEGPVHNLYMHDGFLGATLAVGCERMRGCGQISLGAPITFVYSDETSWAIVTGAEIRFSVGQTLWERLDKSTSSDPTGATTP